MFVPLSSTTLALSLLFFGIGGATKNGTTFLNPILPGFHPDPSCIHVAEDDIFYCASSSFNVFPGIPIHASRDLRNWKLVGKCRCQPGMGVWHLEQRKLQCPLDIGSLLIQIYCLLIVSITTFSIPRSLVSPVDPSLSGSTRNVSATFSLPIIPVALPEPGINRETSI